MVSVNCPTCGSPVSFLSEFSTHSVCGACDSLLVRQGAQVDQIGKVAELQPDGSPLRLGTQGEYKGTPFTLLGRIQLSFGDGFWNEWYVLYSNGETGWLGEAMGEYFINSLAKTSGALPAPSELAAGDGLALGGESFVVTGRLTSSLVSFQGELPFIVDTQTPFTTVDLRSASGRAATIDFSESPPLLFLGEYLPFSAFNFQGVREPGDERVDDRPTTAVAKAGVENFNCPSCGAPHSVAGGVRSKVLVCQYCGSAVDISSPQLSIMWKEEAMREQVQRGVTLPLGSATKLDGQEFKVIGFLKKSVTYEGINYPWTEYLLYNRYLGYRWIVEGEGHFTLMETMESLPSRGNGPVTRPDEQAITYQGKTYRHFQTSNPRVDGVAGEFYWRIRQNEQATNFDYICPPNTLSLESSPTGFVWSSGRYLSQEQVQSMFGLEKRLRPPVGVAPSQPNPYEASSRSNWKVFWVASVLGFFLLASGLLSGSGKQAFSTGPLVYQANRVFPPQESQPFKIEGGGNVAFDFTASMNNRWLFFDTSLVDVTTNKETKVGTTLENFNGQGSPKATVRVGGVPSGDYKLRWSIKSGSKTSAVDPPDDKVPTEAVPYTISLRRGVAVWGWYVLMLIALLPLPLYETARRSSFETKRWYSSDHA